MKILLSNDDGINANGLDLLEEIAREFTDEVTVVAPDFDMSGSGHSLTLKNPLRLREHDESHYSVNGTPTDCVVMALRHIMKERPDFMLSGINYDSNMAEDITYSGTVAAAMEARLLGVPSIAISQRRACDGKKMTPDVAKAHVPKLLKIIMENFRFPDNVFLNVNLPACEASEIKGVKITTQGMRAIEDHVIQSTDPRGKPYFWIGPADYRKIEGHTDENTDLWAVHNWYISVTPVSLDMTDRSSFGVLGKLFGQES